MRRRILPALLLLITIALPTAAPAAAPAAPALDMGDPVVVRAAAVAETSNGLQGVLSTVSVSAARNGTGHVFVDTFPLAQVDMQGSARLATRIATRLAGVSASDVDFYFTLRSSAPVIGGPSAGGILTVAALAAVLDLPVNQSVLMTGTINPDGTIGPVGGIPHKAKAAAEGGATLFLYPKGQDAFRHVTTRYVQQGENTIPVQGSQIREMGEYCREDLGIECRPVEDVLEAVEAVTGHRPTRTPAVGAVELEALQRIVEPRTHELLDATHALVQDGRHRLENATGLSSTGRAAIRALLDRGEGTLYAAEAAARDGRHYTAASRAFQAAIDARQATLLLDATAADDASAHVQQAVERAQRDAERALAEVRAAPLEGALALEARAAAERRALDAVTTLRSLNESLADGTTTLRAALPELAYAIERTGTVRWWADIANDAEGERVDPATIRAATEQVLANVRELAAYAQALDPSASTGDALELAAQAERALRARLAPAALLLALEADVRAQLALENVGAAARALEDARVERARDAAASELAAAQDAGRAALLAQAQFQFAEDMEDPAQALLHYRLARATARFSLLLDTLPEPVPFEPVPQTPAPEPTARVAGAPREGALGPGALAYAGFTLLALGFAVGRAASGPRPPN